MAGRPQIEATKYKPEIGDMVCHHIMEGLSLRKIEAINGMPNRLTILKWLREYPEFVTQYAHAREEQADLYADEIIAIADEEQTEKVVGEEVVKYDATAVARNRLRIDSRKWVAAKLKPKKYGDKLSTEISGPNGGAIETKQTSELDKAILAQYLAGVKK